jgi:hypothetical protein
MEVNLTGAVATNITLIQPWYNGPIIGAAGVIVGAAVAGGLTLIRDYWIRKDDRYAKKNRLIGQLIGHKSLILQYYGFYFFSYISNEYLLCRSTIQGYHGIDYDQIASVPNEEKSKETMRMANYAREESTENKSYHENVNELNKWKWELTKSNKQLWTIIGSLQSYYANDSIFDDLSMEIETAEDHYARFEKVVKDNFNLISNSAQKETELILSKADVSHKNPRDLQDKLFYKLICQVDAEDGALKTERQEKRSDPLETKINALITYLRKGTDPRLDSRSTKREGEIDQPILQN